MASEYRTERKNWIGDDVELYPRLTGEDFLTWKFVSVTYVCMYR